MSNIYESLAKPFFMQSVWDILTNPIIMFLYSIPILILFGVLLGTWLSQPRKPRVLKVQPESGRGEELEIEREDAVNVYCPAISNTPPQRFIKRHQALNIMRKSWLKLTTYPLWFGRYGTAYTQSFDKKDKNSDPVKITLREAIYNIFGKELYEKIPNDAKSDYLKDRIESSSVGVEVEFPLNPLTPEGLPSVSSDDIRRHDIDSLIGAVVRGVNRLLKGEHAGEYLKIIFILGSGIAIGIVLCLIFHWGSPVQVVTHATNSTG